ncbi:YD repeat-containing protein [Pedobacter cryoconitis]|uniref:hypothetical protein n=1 Tax=Pedobacter cryoconitis TaxID=188932 RepID=UPI0016174A46|nr:hypothetical protein [Pedobacter cryoconitis]MBB6272988.1 YD repeat-containing protein [Pedobacter cryoconitis]
MLAKGQQSVKTPDILPPSPSSFALTKYGGINLGLQTGTVQYNIPIYTLNARKLSLNVGLFYSTNGLKVDEIASRTGMSWQLNAGGVITRTVYDRPDENSTRLYPPASFAHNQELYNFLESATNIPSGSPTNGVDIAPDIFSFNFNGYSGKFIIENDVIVQLTKTAVKIEIYKAGKNEFDGKFKITTPDGVVYYFGGANSTESSYNLSIGENCGKGYSAPIENAWYLTKMVHPEGDNITFSYKALTTYTYPASISQSMTRSVIGVQRCGSKPGPEVEGNDSDCENLISTNVVQLSKISTSSNNYIQFNYMSRQDLVSDNLLESIGIFEAGDTSSYLKHFDFNYEYATATLFKNKYSFDNKMLNIRPFLVSLVESGKQVSNKNTYKFDYNDASVLPPRLSYAQDHFGYFNGKNNSGLIPYPIKSLATFFPGANADRASYFEFAKAGTLKKITYPTGGYDSIAYTPPAYNVTELPEPIEQTLSASAVGQGISTQVTVNSEPIVATNSLIATLGASFQFMGNEEDFHAQSYVYLINITTGKTVYSVLLNAQNPVSNTSIDLKSGDTYVVRCTSYGKNSIGSGVLHYYTQGTVPELKSKVTGGVVVDFVKTYDPIKGANSYKKYFYSKLSDLTKSSGSVSFSPVYMSDYLIRFSCSSVTPGWEGNFSCGEEFYYKSMSSNSLNNLYGFSQHHIYFGNVVESFGLNFENGGVEHTYMVEPDTPGEPLLGYDILGSTLSNRGVGKNGLETFTNTFVKDGILFRPVKQVRTTYKSDNRLSEIYYGYTVRKRFTPNCISKNLTEEMFSAFDVARNYIYTRWVYADTVETAQFSSGITGKVTQKEITAYENITHLQPTKITRSNSDDGILEKRIVYGAEMIARNDDPNGVYSTMVNKNMINIPIEITELKNAYPLSLYRTNYSLTPFGHCLPLTIETQTGNEKLETRINFLSYDDKGNLLNMLREKSQKSSYVWSYNKTYPIAEIKNADYSEIEAALGGKMKIDDFANKLHPTAVEINDFLASLKAQLPTAQIISYTYYPLIGVTSQTDAKGKTIYYDYDGFQRLKNIKDQNGNIIQNYIYHYKN